jgi:SsrA-binding protein
MKVINRSFERNYEKMESFEVGISLTGAEAKSAFQGHIRLDEAFVRMLDGQAFLINADITRYPFATQKNYDPKRSRRLLLHKKELLKLAIKTAAKGLTLAPVSCYNKGPYIKLEIALVRGRKEVEKRKLEKKRDIAQSQKREMKEYLKN